MDTKNNKLIGFVAYNITKKCLYITYICIINAYEELGLGALMAFILISITIEKNLKYIYAFGVQDEHYLIDAPYWRGQAMLYEDTDGKWKWQTKDILPGKKWFVSQKLLVEKFGFTDLFKTFKDDSDDDKEYIFLSGDDKLVKTCGDRGETYLDVQNRNSLTKYNEYKEAFFTNPKEVLDRYTTRVSQLKAAAVVEKLVEEEETPKSKTPKSPNSKGGRKRTKKRKTRKNRRKRKTRKNRRKH